MNRPPSPRSVSLPRPPFEDADAIVTGPIHKAMLRQKGFPFMGHTDMLGEICGAPPVMAFTGGVMRVALVTTHIPLSAVHDAITPARIEHTVRTAHAALVNDLGLDSPRLYVCGLNPHAGRTASSGPSSSRHRTRRRATARRGDDRRGPHLCRGRLHDRSQGRGRSCGCDVPRPGTGAAEGGGLWTLRELDLGLPIIRTSVDHGTANDLVGTGHADASSMQAAIQLAMDIVRRRRSR